MSVVSQSGAPLIDPGKPVHGSAFSYLGVGCMIIGPSGTGKSRITADTLMMGAKFIADDRILLQQMLGMLSITAAPELANVLELRGIGIIRINDTLARHVLHLIVELDPAMNERLPEQEKREFHGITVPYLRIAPSPKTSATAVLLYLKAMQEGRVLPTDWMPKAN